MRLNKQSIIHSMFMYKYVTLFLALSLAQNVYGANVADETSTTQCTEIFDPYEKFNRKVLSFNIAIDKTILSPVTKLYDYTVPQWPQDRVSSFFQNLTTPLTFVNNIFQGNVKAAGNSFGRFLINSTLGIGGLFDWASAFDVEDNTQTFSSTLADYGNPYGAYVMLPILGPSTTRGVFGLAVDTATNPVNIVLSRKDAIRYNIAKSVNTRIQNATTIEVAESALDPYSYTRSAYLQYLNAKNPKCKNLDTTINYGDKQ